MEKNKQTEKKIVKIKENDLVNLIDNIVNEAIQLKKQEWINEQAKKETNANSLLESKVNSLEEKLNKLTK